MLHGNEVEITLISIETRNGMLAGLGETAIPYIYVLISFVVNILHLQG